VRILAGEEGKLKRSDRRSGAAMAYLKARVPHGTAALSLAVVGQGTT
jgi:hypothetical protein